MIMHMAKTKGSFAANLMQNQRLKFGLFKAEDTIYIYMYITLQIHSVEHSCGLGGESLRETFTICIMHRSLLAV